MKVYKIFVIILLGLNLCCSYKILGVFPTLCKSHWIIGHSVMKSLAENGHEVHVISPFPLKTPIENYHDVPIEINLGYVNMFETNDWSPIKMIHFLSDIGEVYSNTTLSHANVQKLLKQKPHFDAVIVEIFNFEALYGLGFELNCPVIGLSTFSTSKWTNDLTKTPMEYSYVPHNFMKFSNEMNFFERTSNMLMSIYEHLFMEFHHYDRQRKSYNKFFNSELRSFDEQMKLISLVLVNHHFSFSSIKPMVANMIEIGGIHVSQAKPLPEDIQNFLDSATEGAIIFSMGSIIQATDWEHEKLESFVKAFGKLKQKVLWKYENETLPNKPDNVIISKWLPQRDILAHKNIKLFITHGGLLGTTEALIEGVPFLGIPVYGDQKMNMAKAEEFGIGLTMNLHEINENLILKNINEILLNPKYSENAKAISNRYNDRPMTPQQAVNYWTEYVIRHKGAQHLHSPAHKLNFIQLHMIDSFVFITAIVCLAIYMIIRVVRAVCKLFKNQKLKNE